MTHQLTERTVGSLTTTERLHLAEHILWSDADMLEASEQVGRLIREKLEATTEETHDTE